MALGPAPCLTMCRNPRVLRFAGASRAATPEPEGRALIAFVLAFLLCFSAASARAAAVLTFVASAVRHHQHAALAARRRALVGVCRLQWLWHPIRSAGQDSRGHNCGRSVGVRRTGLLAVQLQVVCGDKSPA